MRLKFIKLEPGARIIGVSKIYIDNMQCSGKCDNCGKELPRDTRVLAKILNLQFRGTEHLKGHTFSPTCMQCANLN
jgi:hypothetical protein